MESDLDRILKNSSKAELIEEFSKGLEQANKALVILIEDGEEGKFLSTIISLGLANVYEAYGILEIARQHLQEEDE